MQRFKYTTLSLLLLVANSSAQNPVSIHSEKPEYSTFQEVVHIEESHRYGVVDPFDSPEAWLRITDIAPGPDNGILVTDNQYQRVDLVIPDRGVVRSYGTGVGAGPGELGQPWASACDSGGQVFISEYGNVRVSIFNSDGEFIRSVRLDHIPGRIAVGEHQDLWVGRTFGSAVDQVDLYNLEYDVNEMTDLKFSYPEKLQEMIAALKNWQEDTRAAMPVTKPEFDPVRRYEWGKHPARK